jgi:hypothetical protein
MPSSSKLLLLSISSSHEILIHINNIFTKNLNYDRSFFFLIANTYIFIKEKENEKRKKKTQIVLVKFRTIDIFKKKKKKRRRQMPNKYIYFC